MAFKHAAPTELLLAQMANVDPGESVKLRVVNESGAERDVTVKTRSMATNVWINPPPAPPGAPGAPGGFAFGNGNGNFWFLSTNP